jgi:SAM-dependent methyltransferase
MTSTAADRNREIWQALYADQRAILKYPSDVFVTLVSRHLNPATHRRVLDFGFGSGSQLMHLAQVGFECAGVEVSPAALAIARARLSEAGLNAALELSSGRIPFDDHQFDAVVAWLVLHYNDRNGAVAAIQEIHRVLAPKGKLLATFARPNDLVVTNSEVVDPDTVIVRNPDVPGQEGAVIFVPKDHASVAQLFAAFSRVQIGYFEWSMGVTTSHWLVIAETA